MMESHRRSYEPGADDDDAGHVGALSLTLMILSWKASSLTWNDSSTETFTSPIAAALDTSSANSPRAACWYESILRMPTPRSHSRLTHRAGTRGQRTRRRPVRGNHARFKHTERVLSVIARRAVPGATRARVCPKSVTVEPKPRPGETRGPELKEGGFCLGFLMLHFLPTHNTHHAPFAFGVGGVFRNSQTKSTST